MSDFGRKFLSVGILAVSAAVIYKIIERAKNNYANIEFEEFDIDGDGVPDAAAMDIDNDGTVDAAAVDVDGDGEPDVGFFDSDGDGVLDKAVDLN